VNAAVVDLGTADETGPPVPATTFLTRLPRVNEILFTTARDQASHVSELQTFSLGPARIAKVD
jgi:hypothetical protein